MSFKDFLAPIVIDQIDNGVTIDGYLIAPFWIDAEVEVSIFGEVIGIKQITPQGRITIARDKPLYTALQVAIERDYHEAIRDEIETARERARADVADMMRGETHHV